MNTRPAHRLGVSRRACLPDDGREERFLPARTGVRGWRLEADVLTRLSAGGDTLPSRRPGRAEP